MSTGCAPTTSGTWRFSLSVSRVREASTPTCGRPAERVICSVASNCAMRSAATRRSWFCAIAVAISASSAGSPRLDHQALASSAGLPVASVGVAASAASATAMRDEDDAEAPGAAALAARRGA